MFCEASFGSVKKLLKVHCDWRHCGKSSSMFGILSASLQIPSVSDVTHGLTSSCIGTIHRDRSSMTPLENSLLELMSIVIVSTFIRRSGC
jgi:hypothetical protein